MFTIKQVDANNLFYQIMPKVVNLTNVNEIMMLCDIYAFSRLKH